MSRFSKAEAEARGWAFVHERDEFDTITSGTQGESRTAAPSIRAEKTVNGTNVSMEGETIGLVLERIASYEAHLESLPVSAPDTLPVSGLPTDDADVPLRTVRTEKGDFTDQEWSAQGRTDTIVTAEGQTTFGGAVVEGEDIAALDRALVERARLQQDRENRRAADEPLTTDVRQVEVSTANAIDSPGIGAGGVVRISADDESVAEAGEKMTERGQEAENARVAAAEDGFGRIPAPEGEEDLAGVDVGLGRRGDLASETPPTGHTVAAVDGEKARGDTEPEAATTEGPTAQAAQEQQDASTEATVEKQQEIRDEKGSAEAAKPESAGAARDAGIEAGQKVADDQAKDDQEGRGYAGWDDLAKAHDQAQESPGEPPTDFPTGNELGSPSTQTATEDGPAEGEPAAQVEIQPGESARVDAAPSEESK